MRLLLPLVLALAVGCVPKARYDAAQGKLAASTLSYEQMLRERDARISDHQQRLAALDSELDHLRGELRAAHEKVTRREAELEESRDTNARILGDRGALRAELEGLREAMRDLEERRARAEARMQSYRDLVSRFQKLIDAGTLEVKIIDGRMVVSVGTDILFASGSADLSREGREALTEVARVLAELDRHFQVEGHTDNVPIRTERFPSNWYLAAARAIGVVDHLQRHGVPNERLSAAAYGEFKPVATNEDDEGRQANRRIEIVVVPDLNDLPGYDDLQALGQ